MTINELAREMREAAEKATDEDAEWVWGVTPCDCDECEKERRYGIDLELRYVSRRANNGDGWGMVCDDVSNDHAWHIVRSKPANVLRILDALDKRTQLVEWVVYAYGDTQLGKAAREALEEE